MKFLDANIFIYAYYRPKMKLNKKQMRMKNRSKQIIKEINDDKINVLTTVVHMSEISNVLKRALSMKELNSLLTTLYSLENVDIVDVTAHDYLIAIELAEELELDPNDALAIHIMQENEIAEILSFDRGFEGVEGIKMGIK